MGKSNNNSLNDIFFKYAPDAYYIIDLKGRLLDANAASEKITGYRKDEFIGRGLFRSGLLEKKEISKAFKLLAKNVLGMSTGPDEVNIIRKDGSKGILEISTHPVFIEGKRVVLGIARDITESKKFEKELFESEEKCRTIFDSARDVILMHDIEGNIINANSAASDLYGYKKSELVGMNLSQLRHSRGEAEKKEIKERLKKIKDEGSIIFETSMKLADGSEVFVEINAKTIEYAGNKAIVSISRDITQRKQAENLIKDMAFMDSLTGLPNRRLFNDRFDIARSGAERNEARLAVLVMDLDGFKAINDSYGHQVGDQVLVEVGKRLKQSIRRNDTVARLGGDEFVILLNDLKAIGDADRITKKIQGFFRDYLVIGGYKIKIRLSIGTSIYPDDGRELEDLIKKSDTAMYWVKNHGRDGYRLYKEAGKVQA